MFPKRINEEGHNLQATASQESKARWEELLTAESSGHKMNPTDPDHQVLLRGALLDFIADFANWDNSTAAAYLETCRALTQVAHESLGGLAGTRPLVVDPFAGGGSIPLEALRVGADPFASDLNPVPVLLNKLLLEYIPQYGERLVEEVNKCGAWVEDEAQKRLSPYYPAAPSGATPIAYLWARTIECEGPQCGATVPLLRSLWLAKRGRDNSTALNLVPDSKSKTIGFRIVEGAKVSQVSKGTVARGAVTCPCCGFTTPVTSVRRQLKSRFGGSSDAVLIAVREDDIQSGARGFRLPTSTDIDAYRNAQQELQRLEAANKSGVALVPDETLPLMSGVFNAPIYGHTTWGSLFTPRQSLALVTFAELVTQVSAKFADHALGSAVQTCLALALDRLADFNSSLCVLNAVGGRGVVHTFGRQAVPMVWDFMETNPFNEVGANWRAGVEALVKTLSMEKHSNAQGHVEQVSATTHPLPNDSAQCLITDPPYYNAIPYADLSDFFYVWLKRTVRDIHPALFKEREAPKDDECCEMAGWDPVRYPHKNGEWFESRMKEAMTEARRVVSPDGVAVVVFAHKTTSGWESQLQAMIEAGWVFTGSWPIDTERPGRLRAQGSAALASSVHLVCRPRENADGNLRDVVGEWRDVLSELPSRIHEWMPRLAAEGVVGADAIFACLGPALEIFSRYSRVEKASGEAVTLREYLEQVWAAVSTEALSMIFRDADAAGLEPDARLTAMWLWTLGGGIPDSNGDDDEDDISDEDEPKVAKGTSSGFTLEFDAARKIAQGLGVHLEQSDSIVEVQGDKARLLPVGERIRHLFGKDEATTTSARGRGKSKPKQRSLFEELDALEAESEETAARELKPQAGETVLDRVHQSMILFASGRGEALRRFLVEDGAGNDARFWKLAQSLSALYPTGTDEKRWVDGVLARKKGLGL